MVNFIKSWIIRSWRREADDLERRVMSLSIRAMALRAKADKLENVSFDEQEKHNGFR